MGKEPLVSAIWIVFQQVPNIIQFALSGGRKKTGLAIIIHSQHVHVMCSQKIFHNTNVAVITGKKQSQPAFVISRFHVEIPCLYGKVETILTGAVKRCVSAQDDSIEIDPWNL